MSSYTLKTQIKNLKKELKEIKGEYLRSKENNAEAVEKYKERKIKLEEYEKEFLQLYEELENLKSIADEYYWKKSKILDQINEGIRFFKKSMSEAEFPAKLEEECDYANRKWREKDKEIQNLKKPYSLFILPTSSFGALLDKNEYLNLFQKEKKLLNQSIKYWEEDLNRQDKENFKKDEEYLKKKRKLDMLTARLEKRNKEKTLANAYLKKSRNDSSSVKSKLKNHEICPYCGSETKELEADHIYPISLGGLSVKENMVYVCKDCNRKKGGATLREFIKKFDLDKEFVEENLENLGKKF